MIEDLAYDVLARRLLGLIWAHATGENQAMPDAADFPRLTDGQWVKVVARATDIVGEATEVSEETFLAAYQHLTGETP